MKNNIHSKCACFLASIATLSWNLLTCIHAGGAVTNSPLVEAAGLSGGFCIVLVESGEDVALAVELGQAPQFVVQILSEKDGLAEQAREKIASAGCGQRVFADRISSFQRLPYSDNLANLMVICGKASDGDALREIQRVLMPRGVILARANGKWARTVKTVPPGMAEWTHNRFDASGNAVSTDTVGNARELRWIAGGHWSGLSLAVASAGGRMFYCISPDNKKSKTIVLNARNAFNGMLLWERSWQGEYETPNLFPYQALPDEKPEWAGKVARFSAGVSASRPGGNALPFTAGLGCLFTVFENKAVALDAATGKTLRTFEGTGDPRDLVLTGETLLLGLPTEILAFHANTGKQLWKATVASKDIVVEGEALYCLDVGRKPAGIVSLDLKTGAERWRNISPPWTEDVARAQPPLNILYLRFCKNNTLIVTGGRGLYAFSARDGKSLWSRDNQMRATKFRYAAYSDAWFWNGLIWAVHYVEDNKDERFDLGLDPSTGEIRKKNPGGTIPHCSRVVATEQAMFSGHYVGFASGKGDFQIPMIRNACNLGVIPANNMLYGMPHPCNCHSWYLPGYQGFGSTDGNMPPCLRLEKGPAFKHAKASPVPDEGGWPCYRHNARRSDGTAETLPDKLTLLWENMLSRAKVNPVSSENENDPAWNGPISPPTVGKDSVYVSLPDRRQTVALDISNGREKWRFTAGGRVHLPPTLHHGLCLIASQDGCVYAVSAADGTLAWRLRARNMERQIMAYGQPESMWPVLNAFAFGDVVYFASGRSSADPDGVQITAAHVLTGELLFEKTLREYSALTDIPALDRDGNFLYFPNISGWELDLKTHKENSLAAVPAERIKGRLLIASHPEKVKGPARIRLVDGATWKGKIKGTMNWRYENATGELLAFTPDLTAAFTFKSNSIHVKSSAGKPVNISPRTIPCSMIVSGSKVVIAGTDEDGKKGCLQIYSSAGALLQEIAIPGNPMYDGLAVAHGRLFVSMKDGRLLCFGAKQPLPPQGEGEIRI
jgi:outer membrane protein assembly factor BamB